MTNNSDLVCNNWEWASTKEWPSYAIPSNLVKSEVILPKDQRVLPFVRMQKEKPRYSLPSAMVSFIDHLGGRCLPEIPIQQIDFSLYLQYETPVITDQSSFEPICDMSILSTIANFSDPRRTFLDYWWRNNSVPTELYLTDVKSKAAFDLISMIDPSLINDGYSLATWYTKYPIPYKEEWRHFLSHNFPDRHMEIIHALIKGEKPQYGVDTTIFLYDDFDNHRKSNKKFWKKATSSKIKGHEKRKAQLGHRAPAQTTTEEEILTLLNMDDIRRVMEDILSKREQVSMEENLAELQEILIDQERDEIPDWVNNTIPPLDEECYDLEGCEDDLLDWALAHQNDELESDLGIG